MGSDYKSIKHVYFSMGDPVSMGTKATSSAVLQTMYHLHFGRTGEWLNTATLASVHSHLYRFSSCSTPFRQQNPGGGFKDVQLSSHFQVASLVMLFETGTFYMMMINIRHVSQCFFKLSVKLSGNTNRCLLLFFFFTVVMP